MADERSPRTKTKPAGGGRPRAAPRAAKDVRARARRSPAEARRLILEAAEKLLAERGPDAVGLKDVARAAGVSHALVSHYFGTYEALVEATLEGHLARHREEALARMAASAGEGPSEWLALAFEHFAEPLTSRLLVWAMMTGRLEREDFVTFRDRGLAQTATAIAAHLAARGERVSREDVELGLLAAVSAAIGYSLGRGPLWGSLGKRASAENDRRFREFLAGLLVRRLGG